MISAGTDVGASEDEVELARKLVQDGQRQIVESSRPIQIVPNAVEDFHDPATQVSLAGPSWHSSNLRG